MKIAQITPGNMEIPPKGWGAIERVIWEYKLGLEKHGHQVDIKYLISYPNALQVHYI